MPTQKSYMNVVSRTVDLLQLRRDATWSSWLMLYIGGVIGVYISFWVESYYFNQDLVGREMSTLATLSLYSSTRLSFQVLKRD